MTLSLRFLGLVALLAASSVGAETATPVAAPALRPVVPAATLPSVAPRLNALVPADALGYLRIPSLWGLLATPKGSVYDQALGSAGYVAAIEGIRAGVGPLLQDLPEERRALAALLLTHARSPVEALILSPAQNGMLPDLLMTVALDFPDVAALGAFIGELVKVNPMLGLAVPFDDQGKGVLSVAGLPVPMQYGKDQRLYVLLGMPADGKRLSAILSGLKPRGEHPLASVEARIDAGGQGLLAWIDVPRALGLAAATGQVDLSQLTALGVGEARSVAVGMGASGGIQRLKVLIDMPRVGWRLFVPTVRGQLDVAAAGEPRLVAQLGLPGPADVTALEQGLAASLPAESMEGYRQGKREVEAALGLSIEELLGTFGQEMLTLVDEAGTYGALRIADRGRFDALLAKLVEQLGAKQETREIAGRTLHHLVIPGLTGMGAPEGAAQDGSFLMRMLGIPSHVYYTFEDGTLLLAGTPQPLIDRAYITARTPVAKWLAERQRLPGDGALLLVTGRFAGLPALMYDANLQILSFLGDLAGRPVDLFAIPTPRELGLPSHGAYGLKLVSSETELSLELAFEHNAAEVLLSGGGYAAMAVLGIAAGVAIPAYEDYVERAAASVAGAEDKLAQVQGALDATEALRDYLASHLAGVGRFPNAEELAELDLSSIEGSYYGMDVVPDEGKIVVILSLEGMNEASLVLTPRRLEGGDLAWECASDLPPEHLPEACR